MNNQSHYVTPNGLFTDDAPSPWWTSMDDIKTTSDWHRLERLIQGVSSEVTGIFQNFTHMTRAHSDDDNYEAVVAAAWTDENRDDDDGSARIRTPLPFQPSDMESAAFEILLKMQPKDWRYLRSTLRKKLLTEAEHLMREAGWVKVSGRWEPKFLAPVADWTWLFGGKPARRPGSLPQGPKPPGALEAMADRYPAMVTLARNGDSHDAAAMELGCSAATVRRQASDEWKLMVDSVWDAEWLAIEWMQDQIPSSSTSTDPGLMPEALADDEHYTRCPIPFWERAHLAEMAGAMPTVTDTCYEMKEAA